MIPDVPAVLNGIVRNLMMDPDAATKSAYRAFSDQLLSMLLMMITQEFDRAAARLVEENDALAALFRDAAGVVRDGELRAALEEGAARETDSLLVSALRARNARLREVLIRLHEHLEVLDDPTAHALDARIWEELVASTRRRQLDLANG